MFFDNLTSFESTTWYNMHIVTLDFFDSEKYAFIKR